jgi:hypothetical protein
VAIAFDSYVVIPDHVLVSQLDGESVLLSLQSESYYGLDEIGTELFGLLKTSGSIQQAYEHLLDRYDVDAETLRVDLIELIENLVRHGLIEVRSAGAAP